MASFDVLSFLGVVWFLVDWVLRIVALFVVPRNRKPTAGMAWLLVIFLFPIVGFLVFFVLGSSKLPESRRNAQKMLDEAIQRTVIRFNKENPKSSGLSKPLPPRFAHLAVLNQSLTHLPVVEGNAVELISEYEAVIHLLVLDIDRAQKHVYLEYYIIVMDEATEPLFKALAQAVARGVVVRVLYDWYATRKYKNYKKMRQRLTRDGVLFQAILPFKLPGSGYVRPDLRNHRKLAVIDNHVGYTGSQNLIRRDYHRKDGLIYDELMVRLQGPIVQELTAVFLTDWYSETQVLLESLDPEVVPVLESAGEVQAQILPSGPGYEDENNLKLFTSIIYAAQEQVTIVNPYFVPDESLITALKSAVHRGVKITLINSEAQDQWMVAHAQRSFYEVLLRAGITIYLYNAPVLLHSKFIIADEQLVTVGSSNFDLRSFVLNLEVTLVIFDANTATMFKQIVEQYISRSTPMRLDYWENRPLRLVLLDNLARLTASLQ